jgi:anaerobic selenocysteine-containing dehydrogenase
MYERDDFPLAFQNLQPTPFRQATEAVVAPAGQAREEWEIIDELARRLWRRTPILAAMAAVRKTPGLFGVRLTPRMLVDALIRLSTGGDRFGLRRGGVSFSKLATQHPHGLVAAAGRSGDEQPEPYLRPGMLRDIVAYRDRRVQLRHPEIETEVAALSRRTAPADFPLRLIGMREPRSQNSWMHDAPLLMRGQRQQRALMHVDDADAIGVHDGDLVRVTSAHGQIELPVALTKDLVAGVVAIPHGWGHRGTGGWRVANRGGGANVNRLMSSDPADLEALAGMARLTGVPVRVEPLDSGTSEETFTELSTSNSV